MISSASEDKTETDLKINGDKSAWNNKIKQAYKSDRHGNHVTETNDVEST